jgi:hypothetical protein
VPVHQRLLEIVLLGGLAAVFLVNAVVAMFQSSDFTGLVDKSRLAQHLGIAGTDWVGSAIFVNDLATGFALLVAIGLPRNVRTVILGWAGLWLLLVAAVKLTALDWPL